MGADGDWSFAGIDEPGRRAADVIVDLLRLSHEMEPSRVAALVRRAAIALGALGSTMHLIGLQQRVLVQIDDDGERVGAPAPIEATVGGRAYVTGRRQAVVDAENGEVTLWVPVVDGTDRLGVLELRLAGEPAPGELWPEDLATAVGLMLTSKRDFTDSYARAARTREATVAAEMIWSLLPPLTVATPEVSVAGILEPAYDIGGDTFDIALDATELIVGVFDSMGHGLQAAHPSVMAVSGFRHARHRSSGIADTVREVDELLGERYRGQRFVTALFLRLELETGLLRWVNAGHPQPLLVRQGRVRGTIPCVPGLPLGLDLGTASRPVNEFPLQAGDRVVLYTDGVTEGRQPGGEPFGEERLADQLDKAALAGLSTAETMRRAAHAVLDHHDHELRDDFTMVLVEFRQPLRR